MAVAKCRCWTEFGLVEGLSKQELLERHYRPERYCTSHSHICPQLDKEYRRACAEAERREQYEKRARASGRDPKKRTPRGYRQRDEVDLEF